MSREYPIPVIDSDEDPSEGTFDSDATPVYENPPTDLRATSDDASSITPPTSPLAMPGPAYGVTESWDSLAEIARIPCMRTTARMRTGRLPTGPLAPRHETSDSSEDVPVEPSPKRQRTEHLAWMPDVLRHWRALEGIPSTYETGESSRSPLPYLITGEPTELTVPTLVAMTNTHVGSIAEMRAYLQDLQSDTARLDGDMISTHEYIDTLEDRITADRETVHTTRARVEALEGRARAAEIVAGASLMMTTLMAAVGMYLSYFG